MYTRFWGFREKPFRQVPNPDFLFLSQTHEEALAHLNYALAEGEGFLMITGEVGTGKSTLCRSFFQKLAADTAYAYIFNSKLDPLQLIKCINAEFGIAAEAETLSTLIDTLNTFLIEKRTTGHRAIIVIDEAQNLPVESLEQVRLLSNLETTHDKLLHLVLVGQPELADMIDSFALRQLGQRIQLACHLHPLTYPETVQYIQHRINLVSEKPQMPFDKGALRAIHAFSKGVPRLINTACDRTLLAAYLKSRPRISARMASDIIDELQCRGRPNRTRIPLVKVALTAFVVIGTAVAAGFLMHSGQFAQFRNPLQKLKMPVVNSADAPEISKAGIEPASASMQETDPAVTNRVLQTDTLEVENALPETVIPIDEFMRLIQHEDTRRNAIEEVLRQWGLDPQSGMTSPSLDDAAYFDRITEGHGLSMLVIDEDFDALITLDLPAVITLSSLVDGQPLYVSVVGVKDGLFDLAVNYRGAHTRTDALTLKRIWDGKAYIPWKNYLAYPGVVPGGTPRAAVILLKQLLWEIGYGQLTIDDRYDAKTRQAIMEIQAKHGLAVDGLVGDMTKIALFNEKQSLPIPHLSKRPSADNRTN